jgi:HAD superfamily hydrolase (TIGR01662 family)
MGLILLDMDGTLVDDALVESEGKLQRPQDQRFHEPVLRPNVFETLHGYALEDDSFAIVTNQGGVAWGYHTAAEVYQRIGRTLELLQFFWGRPFSVHVAFKHPNATISGYKGSDGRKPAATMLLDAQRAAFPAGTPDVVLRQSVMVGDRDEDEKAAEAAGVTFTPAFQFFGW